MGYTQRTPLTFPYPTVHKTACHFVLHCISFHFKKIALKWPVVPIFLTNSYFLRSKCNNKFGIKPMLLSNDEQFNEGPHLQRLCRGLTKSSGLVIKSFIMSPEFNKNYFDLRKHSRVSRMQISKIFQPPLPLAVAASFTVQAPCQCVVYAPCQCVVYAPCQCVVYAPCQWVVYAPCQCVVHTRC